MPGRALTVLRIGSLVARAVPLGALIRLVDRLAPAAGPRLMSAKADQLRKHIERVNRHLDTGTGEAGDRDRAEDAMRQGFSSYGRYWVESFRLPYLTDRELDRGFSFVGFEKIQEVRAAGYGPVLVLPHLGGWEWAAAWLGRIAKVDVTAVVERLEPEEVFDWFARLRQAYGVNVIPLGPMAMVQVSAAVKRTDVVCLVSDRDIGGNGIEVDFFGEATTLPVGPALVARRTGAPLMPVAVLFRGRQRICLVGDPIWPDRLDTAPGEEPPTGRALNLALTQLVADRLAELVALAPDQWHLLEPNWPSDKASQPA